MWLAVVRPTETDFGIEANAIIWRAKSATPKEQSQELTSWTSFSFGEPSITLLPDGSLLATLWYVQDGIAGIRYVKLTTKERTRC